MNRETSIEQERVRPSTAWPAPPGASCPSCGSAHVREFLRAPDRLHGRHDEYTLMGCNGCSLVWLKDPPAPEQMHLHYTDAYNRIIAAGGKYAPQRWRDRNATLTQYKQAGSLLDIGCSSGSFLEFMRSDQWKLYGIEMSPDEAKTARERSGAMVFTGTVVDASFGPEMFDVITCFDVFEHLYDPRRIMERVASWLKPGGIFYVLVPNIRSAEGRVFGSYWHGLELPRHLFHYSPISLKHLAESAGLNVLSLKTRRNPAVGTSLRYVWDDVFGDFRIRRTPVAYRGEASLPWRAARKIMRLTILKALLALAPLVGEGESIHAVFQKGPINSGD